MLLAGAAIAVCISVGVERAAAFRGGGFGGFHGGGFGGFHGGGFGGFHGGSASAASTVVALGWRRFPTSAAGFRGGAARFGDGGLSDRGGDAGFGRGGFGSIHNASTFSDRCRQLPAESS